MRMFLSLQKNGTKARAFATPIVALLLLSSPADLSSQEGVDSLQGRRVRLTLQGSPPYETLVGTLHGADSVGMTLRTSDGALELVPRTRILQVEVQDPSLGKMALAASAIGAVLGYRMYMESGSDISFRRPSRANAVMLGAPVGALLGALLGPALAGRQWQPIRSYGATGPQHQSGLAPTPQTGGIESLEGRRVRLILRGPGPDSIRVGRLAEMDSLGVTLRQSHSATARVPRARIQRIEVPEYHPGIAALAGMGMGALAGVTAYAVWANLTGSEGSAGVVFVIAMPAGALVGAIVGSALARAEAQWLPIHLDPAGQGGLRVGVRLALP